MPTFEFCTLGASKLDEDSKLPVSTATSPITDDEEDVEHFGEVDVYEALGVTALPYPANDDGKAEGLILRGLPGVDGVRVGARDERTAAIVGNLKPGDTVLHSTGPEQAAQFQCKEEKRQAVVASKDTQGKTMLFALDGKNDKSQLAVFGYLFEVSRSDGITLTDATGKAGIQIKDGVVSIFGSIALGGRTPAPTPFVYGTPGPGQLAAAGVFPGL